MNDYEEMEDEEKYKSFLDCEIFKDKTIEEHNNEVFNLDISLIKETRNHYFCHECKYFPYIQFENQFIIFTCKCGENKVDLFSENEIWFNRNINDSNSLYNNSEIIWLCEEGHKFRYYCCDCHKNYVNLIAKII